MRVNTNKYIIYNNYAEIVTKQNQSILIDLEQATAKRLSLEKEFFII